MGIKKTIVRGAIKGYLFLLLGLGVVAYLRGLF